MPLPLAAAIGAGATLASGVFNSASQGNMNKKNRQWQEKMYNQQKNDEISFWNMQNSYNSPQEQMKRLQDANLNPHLAYGNGSVANTGGDLSTPHASAPETKPMQINLPAIVDSYFDVKQKSQALDNLKEQGNLMKLDAMLKLFEAKGKDLNNRFLNATFDTRVGREQKESSFLGEKILAQAFENEFKAGYKSPNLFDLTYKDGFYDKQAKGQDLINKLRGQESKAKKQDYDINTLRKNYYDRIYSPDASSLSFKDWMQMFFQGVNAFK